MRRTLIAAVLLAFAPACGTEENPDSEGILDLSGDADNGATLYGANCAVCHAADGSGGSGPSLKDNAAGESDSEIITIILDGEGSMPSFRAKFSDQEVADVLEFIRRDFG